MVRERIPDQIVLIVPNNKVSDYWERTLTTKLVDLFVTGEPLCDLDIRITRLEEEI